MLFFIHISIIFYFIINCSTKVYAADSDDNYTICNESYVRDKGSYEITIQFKGIDFKNKMFKETFNVSGSKTFEEIDGIFSNGTILENYYYDTKTANDKLYQKGVIIWLKRIK